MATQTVFDVVQAALPRELTQEERQLLRRLSPQGVAKLNNDLLSGVPISQTLADLKTVFAKMHERKATIVAELSDEARYVLNNQLGRLPTMDELTLFISLPIPFILSEVKKRMKEANETFDSAVEELANEYKYQRLSKDAQAFGETQSMPTRVCVLTPVLRPATPNGLAPNMATLRKRMISIGLSPIVLWFNPHEEEDTDSSDDSSDSVLPDIPSHLSLVCSISSSFGSARVGSPKCVWFVEANNSDNSVDDSNSSSESLPKLMVSPPMSPTRTPLPGSQPAFTHDWSKPPKSAESAKSAKSVGENRLVGLSPTPPPAAPIAESKFRRRFLPSLFKTINSKKII